MFAELSARQLDLLSVKLECALEACDEVHGHMAPVTLDVVGVVTDSYMELHDRYSAV